MKIYTNIDHSTLESDPRVILKIPDSTSSGESYKYLLDDRTHLIWASRSWYPGYQGSTSRWVGGTRMEFPRNALPWFIDVLENKFFKLSRDGGLPKSQFAYEEDIDSEHLVVARMMGTPGYSFRNDSRQNYTYKTKNSPQAMDLSDDLLFEQGLFDKLKGISSKIKSGKV